jgi:hypothetical protein
MSIEVMRQALDALDCIHSPLYVREIEKIGEAMDALRDAIEQAAEPVAWQVMVEDEAMKEFLIKDMAHDWCVKQKLSGSPYSYWMRPLYTTPPVVPRQWVGLTNKDIIEMWPQTSTVGWDDIRLIEAKLKEKNT